MVVPVNGLAGGFTTLDTRLIRRDSLHDLALTVTPALPGSVVGLAAIYAVPMRTDVTVTGSRGR
jgi:hypothetical protein